MNKQGFGDSHSDLFLFHEHFLSLGFILARYAEAPIVLSNSTIFKCGALNQKKRRGGGELNLILNPSFNQYVNLLIKMAIRRTCCTSLQSEFSLKFQQFYEDNPPSPFSFFLKFECFRKWR